MTKTRKHFHTFDALRFFSFFLVFIHHLPGSNSPLISYFTKSGGIGVTFFFVLSGFLITYILLHEKLNLGKISLKKFFMRRILRIWPLFYAMILFAFLTPFILKLFHLSSSNEGYEPNWLMSILFLENYKMMITDSFPNVSPLRVMWSLCIEEHFYIIWGVAISFLSIKKVPHLIMFSILLANICRILYGYIGIETIDLFTNIDYFAFGAIPAYILMFKSELLHKIETLSLRIKYLLTFFAASLIFIIPNLEMEWLTYIYPLIYGVSFSMIITFTLCEKNSLHISDGYWISKLGMLTYGLYLFHPIVINLLIRTREMLPFQMNWGMFLLLSIICTIAISIISYHLFEKQFLKLKKYFY
ncbi:MAG: peptidoglycan/LPS O-acetylase OafA/YrhL [Maribacter sp.]|jgi:peptidoglycan/LPS O-acetylase OafA/YrhL